MFSMFLTFMLSFMPIEYYFLFDLETHLIGTILNTQTCNFYILLMA